MQNSQYNHLSSAASTTSSSIDSTSHNGKKKKKKPRRRFLPMMSRRDSSSSDEEDVGFDSSPLFDTNFDGGMQNDARSQDGLRDNFGPLHQNYSTSFKSALGQRIWNSYRLQSCKMQRENVQSTELGEEWPSKSAIKHPSSFLLGNSPPEDFLRLPPTMIRLKEGQSHHWVDIQDLGQKVLQCHLDAETPLMHDESDSNNLTSLFVSDCCSQIIRERDNKVGLGMSLREYDGCVYVQAVLRRDGMQIDDEYASIELDGGPAFVAGLRPGDRLLGLNGRPFLRGRLMSGAPPHTSSGNALSEEILKSVGDAISRCNLPLVIHYQREYGGKSLLEREKSKNQRSIPAANLNGSSSPKRPIESSKPARQNGHYAINKTPPKPKGPHIHPFAKALSERKLIQPGHEEQVITQQIRVLCDRTRQWESKLSFRLRASDFKLRPMLDPRDVEPTYYASFFADDKDAPPFFNYRFAKSLHYYAPSTPMIQDWRQSRGGAYSPVRPPNRRMSREAAVLADLYAGLDEDDTSVQDLFLGGRPAGSNANGEGVRQGGGIAYPVSERLASVDTKHANDVIVPLVGVRKAICVRILNSFLDNKSRAAFSIWCYDVESGMEWWAPVRYHEDFRDLRVALLRIDKSLSDIPFPNLKWGGFGFAMVDDAKESVANRELRREQLECFLRRAFAEVYRGRLHPYLAEVAIHLQTFVGCDGVLSDDNDSGLALNHQVAISETTYGRRKSEPDSIARVQLKRSIQRYVYRIFLLPSIERLISQFVDATKKSMTSNTSPSGQKTTSTDIEKIRDFIDQMQGLILEGCHDDLMSMSQRRDFAVISDFSNFEDLFREAVREQVELEVYVPLRTTISKHLVRAFYNEDVEMKHKIKALENKPQSYFRIHPEHRSPSDWKSVSTILREGVGRSTLPCVKLRAIVDAAKEIPQLHSKERGCFAETSFFDGPVKTKTLGADDFLPIFIFCFVNARLERPCALCELLQTMCDPLKLNGETGYYLASFYAAMTHINELDLTEANDELSIFLDVLPD